MEDRRIFERITARFPVRFLEAMEAKEGRGSTCDVSANGVSFVTNEDLAKNAALELWLEIPDSRGPLYTRGRVVWLDNTTVPGENRVGIRLERAELMGLARALWVKK